MKYKSNKRGNIPVTILVLGVLVICGLAIFSFYLGNNQVLNDVSDVSVVEKIKLDKEKFDFYVNNLEIDEGMAGSLIESFKNSGPYGKHFSAEEGDIRVIYQIP